MQLRRLTPPGRPFSGLAFFVTFASLAASGLHCGGAEDDVSSATRGPNAYNRDDGDAERPREPPGGNNVGGGSAGAGSGAPTPGAERPDGAPAEPVPAPACSALDDTKPLELFLSADDSNSMASPVIARRFIRERGMAPPASILRTYEFLNYYNVPYGNPAAGTLGVDAQLRVNAAGEFELQVGVQAPPREVRRPMTLTFVLDTSGSMAGVPLDLLKEAVRAAASQLQAGDVVSLVTWNTANTVALAGRVVEGPNDPALLEAVGRVQADGGTDLHGGLVAGYQLAEQHDGPGRVNRIILISDGAANVGVTDEALIAQKSDSENKEGIYLVGVGVGEGVNDTLMDAVTDAGNGAYVYLDGKDEAWRMFGERFSESVEVAARNVQVRARLPWYLSMRRFFGEEYSTEPFRVKPQHLAPGDAMVISQVLAPCQGAPVADADAVEVVADWVEPLTYVKKTATFTSTVGELKAGTRAEIARGKAIVAYAEWLKAYPTAGLKRAEDASRVVALADAADVTGNDPALAEIRELVRRLEPAAGGPVVRP
jgi:Ca-activated chloride channel family protein